MSLRRRIVSLIALIMPLSLLVAGVVSYLYSVNLVRKEMASAVEQGETTVREVVAALTPSSDIADQIVRLVATFNFDRDIRVSHVMPSGKVIAESRMAKIDNPPPSWLRSALSGPFGSADVELPSSLGNFGKIRIDAAPESEISEVWEEMTLQFLILTGFFMLVSWLVSWTLDRALRPLDNLAVALTEVGQGRFTAHVPENGPEELLAIYREFNRMALHLKAAEQQNRALTIQLNTVQEEERNDLARDLHDEIGPFLFAVDVDAQIIPQYAARGDAGEVSTRAGAIRQSVAHMQRHLRSILSRLRPALLLDLGLAQAIDHLVSFWKKRQPGIEIVANVTRASYGASIDEIAFRTIQEALNNAVRHAKPAHIEIKVFMIGDTTLHVSIRDDGSGLAPNAPAGFGLAGMRERISAAGGALEVASNRDKPGVTVVAQLPLGGVPAISNSTEERRTSSP